jgi:Domain of unknown function (DUF5914)/Rieske [2Fe-2S] domain
MPRRPLLWNIGSPLVDAPPRDLRPEWLQASPRWIERALRASQALPAGGWYALCASREIGTTARHVIVAGRDLVVWRDGQTLYAAPEACPHLGASLAGARLREGCLECPWHGLRLGPEGHGRWRTLPSHDDGVLFWVRLENGEPPAPRPLLPQRPARYLDAVLRVEARCDPEDVIANRLDPWHGAYLHHYAFARVRVVEQHLAAITLRVAYRVLGPVCIEVDARFHCIDRRTVVMTIVAGDGTGSVVETHATPLGKGRTAIVEATLASSERPAFGVALAAASFLRPLVRRAATRLWRDDAAYAERRHARRIAATRS